MFDLVQTGDRVTRILGGSPMELTVTSVEGGVITCGPWTFDQKTGAEIDDEIGWGPPPRATGSYLRPHRLADLE